MHQVNRSKPNLSIKTHMVNYKYYLPAKSYLVAVSGSSPALAHFATHVGLFLALGLISVFPVSK